MTVDRESKIREPLRAIIQNVAASVNHPATRKKELLKRREQLKTIVQLVTKSIDQDKRACEDETLRPSANDSCIGKNTTTTRSEEMKKRRESLQIVVQDVTTNRVQSKQSTHENAIVATFKHDSDENRVVSAVATRHEEMKKRRKQLQLIVQNVSETIEQTKKQDQVVEQIKDDDSTIATVSTSDDNSSKEGVSARNAEMKKRRQQLQVVVQGVTENIVAQKENIVAQATPKPMQVVEQAGCKHDEASDFTHDESKLEVAEQSAEEDGSNGGSVVHTYSNIDSADIIREGWLLKQSKVLKVWRKRWFVLTSSCLYAFKKENDTTRPTEFICFDECSCVRALPNSAGQRNVLCLDTPDRTLLLRACSATERDAWTEAVHDAALPSMLIGGNLGHRLSRFSITEEEDELDRSFENDCECESLGKKVTSPMRKPWELAWVPRSEAAFFKLLGNHFR